MDIYQLQRQIQDLRQEVNSINQVASQLQRSEANNAAQLQRLQQNEAIATQQLQTIQQLCNRLNQDVNVISNVAQQVTSQMYTKPMTSGQYGTYSQPTTGQFGALNPSIGTSMHSPSQYGAFGSQLSANRIGAGFHMSDYTANPQLSSMLTQGMTGIPSNIAGTHTANLGTGYNPFTGISAGSLSTPAHQMHASQYGTSGFAGSQFAPYSASQISASALPTTGLLSQPLASTGMYSSSF